MKIILKVIYNKFFTTNEVVDLYLGKLSDIIQKEFHQKEVDFLIKCIDLNVDIETIELALRSRNKNNIISFTLLRLSALAESTPENQSLYVNKTNLSIVQIFLYLTKTIINFVLHKLKAIIIYSNLIKEYPNV